MIAGRFLILIEYKVEKYHRTAFLHALDETVPRKAA